MSLLMLLALRGRPCTRAELVEHLYPHLDPEVATTQLKVYVHRVRRKLGDVGAIVFQGTSYRLGASFRSDFLEAEADVACATRCKGELKPELQNRLENIRGRLLRRDISWSSDREWEVALERRLVTMLFDVTVRLGEAALAGRDVESASRFAAEISHLDPCDERGAELAIRAHILLGNQRAALQQLRRYERALKEEFEAKPSDELYALACSPAMIQPAS